MDLEQYQKKAKETDKTPSSTGKGVIIPLLGLAGEVGTLLSEYKNIFAMARPTDCFMNGWPKS